MYWWQGTTLACLIALDVSVAAGGRTVNDAIGLLKRARETCTSLNSFQFEGVTLSGSGAAQMQNQTAIPFEVDFVAPLKMHIEVKHPDVHVLFVFDGHTGWIYGPATKTYCKFEMDELRRLFPPVDTSAPRDMLAGFSGGAGLMYDVFQVYTREGMKDAKIMNEENLQVEGEKVACYVVRVEYDYSKEGDGKGVPSARTLWIDKDRYLVLRESTEFHDNRDAPGASTIESVTSELTKVRINEPVPGDLFVFTRPQGAKEVKLPPIPPRAPNLPK